MSKATNMIPACPDCDGTGLLVGSVFPNAILCDTCKGRGYFDPGVPATDSGIPTGYKP